VKYWRKPLDEATARKSRGEIVVIVDRCKGCGFCIAYCPRGVLRLSSGFNKKGYHPPEVVNAPKCAACHFCEALCPEFAIYVVEPDIAK
jgi:2-oxoglutarate ferredoxin oxidoreductase subunit delta